MRGSGDAVRFGHRYVRRLGFGVVWLVAAAAATAPLGALVHQFDNTTAGAISNNSCGAPLVRTFTVSASFTVAQVAVGFNVSHNSRGQVEVTLTSPGGTEVTLLPGAADTDNNYDILLSTNTDSAANVQGVLDDNDEDPVAAPIYNRLVTLAGLSAFSGVASAGTWTLEICDDTATTSGTFNSARLVLADATAATAVCSSRATVNWGSFANNTNFSNTTVGGVTMTETASTDIGGTGATPPGAPTFRTTTATTGNEAGYYRLWMDNTDLEYEEIGQIVDFSFSLPVHGLGFSIIDNDFATGDFEDYHRMEGTRSGSFVPFQVTIGSAAQIAGDIVEGDTAAADNETTANALYLFGDQVEQLRAVYMTGNLQDAPENQLIGIGDISFCTFDYGDAPASYGTTLGTGARHVLGARAIWLGANRPDGEADGQAAGVGADATPDDAATVGGVDDEDAVATFPVCPQDGTYSVTVAASNASSPAANAFLVGYVDWNRDGDFADADERSATVTVPQANADPSNFSVTWSTVPANCGGTAATYARFRISSVQADVESPTGEADDGEIEDYRIPVDTLPVTISWVSSRKAGAETVVEWRTSSETGNVGFRIWGLSKTGRRLLARVPSASFDSFSPRDYRAVLPAGDLSAVEIVDLSVTGRPRRHGPFVVGREHGSRGGERAIDWASIRAGAEHAARGLGEGAEHDARLLVERAGIQRVTFEDLAAAGVDLAGVAAAEIGLADGGKPIARHVSADPFGPGAWIEFLVPEPETSLASPHDVVVLSVGGAEAISPRELAVAADLGEARVAATLRARPDRAYGFASPTSDPWYDESLLSWGAPRRIERRFDLPDWAGGAVALALGGWGYTDWPGDAPDHHVSVTLNGVEIASDRFDGIAPWSRALDVSSLVVGSGNVLEIAVPGDTGFAFDLFAFDGFDVDYVRSSRALDGAFRGTASRSYAVGGFGAEPIVAWAVPGPVALATTAIAKLARVPDHRPRRGTAPAGAGAIAIPAGAGEVFAAAPGVISRPQVVAGAPAASPASGAEYLIVSHPAFRAAIGELEAFEAARGYEVEVVEVESIYAAYSDHAASPEALRRFLAASLEKGRLRYVLLVGTDTTDPWNRLGTGAISFVPTAYLPAGELIRFAPTDEHLADADGDRIADVPIGRLPVRTADELSAVVAKLAQWEARSGETPVLLAAGGSDGDGRLTRVNDGYAKALAGWPQERVEVDQLGGAIARDRILAALDAGTPLVSFVGHSSPDRWDFEALLAVADVETLANVGRPSIFLQWGCWNSYAFDPQYESLSSRLLLEPEVGAAGTVGATTLTADRVHDRLALHFLDAMRAGPTTLGEALREAKLRLRAEGAASDDVLLGVAILGDPASTLPFDE